MSDDNCPITGMVDFGKGEVEVRCTETGEHEQHVCVVLIGLPKGEGDAGK